MGRAGRRFLKFWTCGPICLGLEIAKDRRKEEAEAEQKAKVNELIAEGKIQKAQLLAEAEEYQDAEIDAKARRDVVIVTTVLMIIVVATTAWILFKK